MKRMVWAWVLAAEAVLCAGLSVAGSSAAGAAGALLGFPWQMVGQGLRWMSLSGGAGNAAALALYAVCGLLPLIWLLVRWRRGLHWEDALLVALSVALFAGLYWLINPGTLAAALGMPEAADVLQLVLNGLINAVLVGYALLRMVRAFSQADMAGLRRCLTGLLAALSALLVYRVFGAGLSGIIGRLRALRAANTALSGELWISCGAVVLRDLADILPWALDVPVALSAMRLMAVLNDRPHSPEAVAAADGLSRRCVRTLAACVACSVAANLLQLLCLPSLRTVSASVELPLTSMGVALAALLLAQYVQENKRLKDDNDMFI